MPDKMMHNGREIVRVENLNEFKCAKCCLNSLQECLSGPKCVIDGIKYIFKYKDELDSHTDREE